MTPAELKRHLARNDNERYHFDRANMRFFGDTMRNYGVRDAGKTWELYRKHAVKHGMKDSAHFDKETFDRVFPENEEVKIETNAGFHNDLATFILILSESARKRWTTEV